MSEDEWFEGCVCPLLDRPCLEEKCMWYDMDEKACAIYLICDSLMRIAYEGREGE